MHRSRNMKQAGLARQLKERSVNKEKEVGGKKFQVQMSWQKKKNHTYEERMRVLDSGQVLLQDPVTTQMPLKY